MAFRRIFEIEALDGGLNTRFEPDQIDETESPDCANVVYDDISVKTREGTSRINTAAVGSFPCDGLFTATYNNGNQSMVGVWDDSAYVLSGTTFVTIGSSQGLYSGGSRVDSTMYQNVLFLGQGNTPYKYNGTEYTRQGVTQPDNTVSAISGGSAGNLAGDYLYKIAFVNSYTATGDLPATAIATVNVTATGGNVLLTSIPVGVTSHGIDARKIYRTDAGGSSYKLIDTISDNTTTTYDDDIASSAAGAVADSDAGLPPNWTYVITMQERLFCVDADNNPQVLYYSNLADPYVYKSTNFILISDGDGEKITGLGIQSNSVIVYKENSVWAIYMPSTDDSTWIRIKLDAKYGAAANGAIVTFGKSQLYIGLHNQIMTSVYALQGSTREPSATNLISSNMFADDRADRVEPDIFLFQESYRKNFAGIEFKNKVFFAVTSGTGTTQNNKIFVYHFYRKRRTGKLVGGWTPFTGLNAAMFTIYNQELYYASSLSDGFLYKMFDGTYNDNSAAINSYMWTKEFGQATDDRDIEKDYRTAHFNMENTGDWDMGVSFKTDAESGNGLLTKVNLNQGGNNWGSMVWQTQALGTDVSTWGGGQVRKNAKINLINRVGKTIQFLFDNRNTADSWFKVIRGRYYYNTRGLR